MTADVETYGPVSFKSPRKSKWSAAYWDGLQQRKLVFQKCNDCGAWTHPPGPVCTSCLSRNVTHKAVSGKGHVYTYTVTHRPMHAEFQADAPYTIAYIKLDEGITIVSWLRNVEPSPEIIGARVRAIFEVIDSETTLHRFEPDTE
jgi:uncharacterized OB-fold protein